MVSNRRTKRQSPPRKLLLFGTVAVALAVLAGLLVVEVALVLTDQPRFLRAHPDVAQFEPVYDSDAPFPVYTNSRSERIRFVYETNPRGYFGPDNEVEHVTNSLGFRGPEFQPQKTSGVLRIAFLGDSVAFGEGVRDEHTYAEQTAVLLQETSGTSGQRYESLNFGVGGYNIQLAHNALKQFALPMKPDIVVVNYTLNDAEPPLFVFDEQTGRVERRSREADVPEGQGDPEPPDSVLFKLRTAQLAWKAIAVRSRTNAVVGYYKSLYQPWSSSWLANRNALREIIAECTRRDIPCYVVCFPVLYRLDNTYPFEDVHALVGQVATEAGATFVDLLPLLKGHNASSLQVHPTDQHPNEIAHRVAAEALAAAIKERTL